MCICSLMFSMSIGCVTISKSCAKTDLNRSKQKQAEENCQNSASETDSENIDSMLLKRERKNETFWKVVKNSWKRRLKQKMQKKISSKRRRKSKKVLEESVWIERLNFPSKRNKLKRSANLKEHQILRENAVCELTNRSSRRF